MSPFYLALKAAADSAHMAAHDCAGSVRRDMLLFNWQVGRHHTCGSLVQKFTNVRGWLCLHRTVDGCTYLLLPAQVCCFKPCKALRTPRASTLLGRPRRAALEGLIHTAVCRCWFIPCFVHVIASPFLEPQPEAFATDLLSCTAITFCTVRIS